ncbi:class II aldolase/adducin family protein, partial [Thermodesulfobacteriota bacterium]
HDLGLEEITPQDIIIIDFEGNKLVGQGRKHSEFPIHTEIYKMYPHINCIIHTHPFYSLILGATADTIKTISHEGSLFAGIPIFTETALLIRSAELGQAVAGCLNEHRAILLRNHGVVVAGTSIEEATVYAVLLERAAKLQVMASQVGKFHSCSQTDIEGKGEQVFYSKNIMGFWDYFVRKLHK